MSKKTSQTAVISLGEMIAKRDILAKELVHYKLSMDIASLKSTNSLVKAKRELRILNRNIASVPAQGKLS